jgi:hypothetical protein
MPRGRRRPSPWETCTSYSFASFLAHVAVGTEIA